MAGLRLLWSDPALRVIAVLMMLFGAVVCTFGPYVSVLAVEVFGLGDRGFAALLVTSTALSVAASVWVGIRADQTAGRRSIALVSCGLLAGGAGLMVLAPGAVAFVVAHGLVLPLASTLFGQLFAQGRIAALAHPPAARDGIMASLRALFALPFVAVLPLWALAFGLGAELLSIYPVCLGLAVLMLAMALRGWPADRGAAGADAPSGLSFGAALAEIARPRLLGRLLALGAVNAGGTLYMAIVGLVLVPAVGRGAGDVALYAGLVAGLEVPFMLALPQIMPHIARTRLILIGAAVYCIHVAGLPFLAGSPFVWLLILPAAAGGAVVLTIPIAYLQDLLADRPGTGASLMALQRLTGDVLAALCFAVGTAVSGYGTVAVLGAAVVLTGALALHLADRPRRA